MDGLEDLLSWIQTRPSDATDGALQQYRDLRDQYEDLAEKIESAPIFNHLGSQDERHQAQLVHEGRARYVN